MSMPLSPSSPCVARRSPRHRSPPSLFLPLLLLLLSAPLLLLIGSSFSPSSAVDEVQSSPIVNTEYGPIRGQLLHVVDPVDGQPVPIVSFMGVPFARPPLGELRFEKPLEPEQWAEVRNATEMAPACWPIARAEIYAEPDQLSEDCLYLNIFGPPKLPSADGPAPNLSPVIVYIHGGGFQAGTMRQFKPSAIAKFVRRDILFVTIQYRLAMLGFAASGAAQFAGNYGLWDQTMALQFLRRNLVQFGGDPSLVTLWGFSAGAASAGLLSVSPHAHSLFNGNTLVEWSANDRVLGETQRLALAVGCGDSEVTEGEPAASEALKKCLRQKTPQELMDGIDKIGRGRADLNFLQFHPRYDSDFFPADSVHLIQNAPPKRTIMGVTSHEALTFTLFSQDPTLMSTEIPRAQWASFGRADLHKFIVEKIAPEKFFGDTAQKAQQRVWQFYVGKNGGQRREGEAEAEAEDNGTNEFWLAKYNEIITDTMFLVPMQSEAWQKMAAGWPIYLYQIEHINSGYPSDIPVKGCFHCIELGPLFEIPFPYKFDNATEVDRLFRMELIDTITTFAKTGVPRTQSAPNWHPTNRQLPLQYARFTSYGTHMEKALAPEKLDFWRKLSAEFPFDIIRGIRHDGTQQPKEEL